MGIASDAWWLALLRWPVLLLAVLGGLAVLYRYGPSRDAPRWRWVTWGSAIAAILWIGGSLLFSWYVAHFGSYNKTYGSLGAAIGFMTWIWISTIIVLLGAQVNAEMEHQTSQDTTVGQPNRWERAAPRWPIRSARRRSRTTLRSIFRKDRGLERVEARIHAVLAPRQEKPGPSRFRRRQRPQSDLGQADSVCAVGHDGHPDARSDEGEHGVELIHPLYHPGPDPGGGEEVVEQVDEVAPAARRPRDQRLAVKIVERRRPPPSKGVVAGHGDQQLFLGNHARRDRCPRLEERRSRPEDADIHAVFLQRLDLLVGDHFLQDEVDLRERSTDAGDDSRSAR